MIQVECPEKCSVNSVSVGVGAGASDFTELFFAMAFSRVEQKTHSATVSELPCD